MKVFCLDYFFDDGADGMGQTHYSLSSGNYAQNFANIANVAKWPNGFNAKDSQFFFNFGDFLSIQQSLFLFHKSILLSTFKFN